MVAELVPTVGYHKCTCAPTRIRIPPFFGVLQTTCSLNWQCYEKGLIEVYGIVLAFAGHSPTPRKGGFRRGRKRRGALLIE